MAPASAPARRRRRILSALAATAIVTLVGLGAAPAIAASATWSTPVAITADQGDTVGTVTAPDGTITTVVESYTVGITAVSSTDGGATWQTPVALGSGGDAAFRATIGITSSGLLAVAWVEETAGVRAIQVVISADGGSTWSAPFALPTVENYVDDPAIGSSSALGFTVVWSEDSFDKRASSTTDGGTTWSAGEYITQDRNSYGTASLASVGEDDIVVVFQEFYFDVGHTIHSRRSTDGGVTWAAVVTVAPDYVGSNFANSRYTTVVSPSPGKLVVFWDDPVLFAATSTDNGDTWGPVIEVSVGPDDARDFAPAAVDASTVAVVWHQSSGSGSDAYYAEVELDATSASTPVPIDPASTLFYDRQPTLTAFGTSRVASWFAEDESASDGTYGSAVSCDGGATWRASTTIASGDDVSSNNAVVARSGTVVAAFWSEYDALIDESVPLASVIDDPCSAPVAIVDDPELAATGPSELAIAVLVAALGMLAAGLAALGVRRAAVRG